MTQHYKHPHTSQVVAVETGDEVRARILEQAGFRQATEAQVSAAESMDSGSHVGAMSQPTIYVAPMAGPPIGGPERPGEAVEIDRQLRRWTADEMRTQVDAALDAQEAPEAAATPKVKKAPVTEATTKQP